MANPGWAKGVSGNPGGRPKQDVKILDLCRKHSLEAVGVLVEIMRDKDAPSTARLGAAQAVLDRGWGRPAQIIAGDPEAAPVRLEFDNDELARRIALILVGKGK